MRSQATLADDTVKGGTHEWPMDTRTKINNSIEVWNFFKQYSLATTTGIRPLDAATSGNSVSATYAKGIVNLRGIDGPASIRIIDTRGRVITALSIGHDRFAFPNSVSGVYHVLADSHGKTLVTRFLAP